MSDELFDAFGPRHSVGIIDSINSINSELSDMNILEAQLKDAHKQAKRPPKITGKPFEQLIVDSVYKYQSESVDIERFHDSEWNRNICDYLIQWQGMTAWVEAKTTDTNMPFHKKPSRNSEGKLSKSKFKQQPLLLAKSIRSKAAGTRHRNMIGLLVQFKRKGIAFQTWWVDIDDVYTLQATVGKKSFNTDDLQKLYIESETHNTYEVELYQPKRARKLHLNIHLMMKGGL